MNLAKEQANIRREIRSYISMKSGLESSLTNGLWVDSEFLFWIVPKSGIVAQKGPLEKQPQATAANCSLEFRYKIMQHADSGVTGCLALTRVPLFMEAEFGTISEDLRSAVQTVGWGAG